MSEQQDDLADNTNLSAESRELLRILRGDMRYLESKFEQHATNVNSQFSLLQSDINHFKNRSIDRDPCEKRFKGLPPSEPDVYFETIKTILNFIKCPYSLTDHG